MRPGVRVGAGRRLGQGDRSGLGADHARRLEVRRRGRDGGELGRELPEGAVRAAPLDQAEGGQVPEQGRAAVAQHHLVPVGQPEQLGQPGPDRADQVLDRGLAVRGAEQRGAGGRQGVHRIRSDLGRPTAEAAVAGKQLTGDGQRGHDGRLCHACRRARSLDRTGRLHRAGTCSRPTSPTLRCRCSRPGWPTPSRPATRAGWPSRTPWWWPPAWPTGPTPGPCC